MLLTRLRRLARVPGSGFAAADGAGGGTWLEPEEGLAEAEAEVVEGPGGRLRAIRVGQPVESRFTCFLDGIQRAEVALYHGPVPVVYAYAAAVVRARRNRRMGTLEVPGASGYVTRYQEEREAVFFPFRYVDPSVVRAAVDGAGEMVDTGPENDAEPLPLFPPLLYARAAQRVNRWREELEATLAKRWCASAREEDGWLLVDGSLTLSGELARCTRAVGVVKSHRTRFFDGEDARTLLALGVGERTSVFRPGTRSFTPVYSWYLRLRPHEGRDALWGLVRVEMAARAETLELADEVSRWLLAETAPLALPDPRWDRLLYPIRDCEEYLRARAPRWS
ncbi:MAG TPA: hypothetical protein VIL18_02220 [Longimicrobiales bacterium]